MSPTDGEGAGRANNPPGDNMPNLHPSIVQIMRGVLCAYHICWRPPEPEDFALDACLDDLGFDNLDRQTLAVTLDEHFDIYLPDDALAGWERVADVVASVEALLAAKEAA